MKLIIDIPKDVYKRTVFYREFRDLNDCVTTLKALENGTPLEEELEKIKKEIEQDAFKDVNDSKYIFVNRVNQIINKYKAELKGETE